MFDDSELIEEHIETNCCIVHNKSRVHSSNGGSQTNSLTDRTEQRVRPQAR